MRPCVAVVTHGVPYPPAAGNEQRIHRLLAWLRGPRRRGLLLHVSEDEPRAQLAARVRAVLPARFGDTLGATRGEG